MNVKLIKENRIEEVVKFCKNLFEVDYSECFASNINIIQTFQQLNIVRNFYFNNAIKVFGMSEKESGKLEKLMIVRLADAIEYISALEILILSVDSEFMSECIDEIKDYFAESDYSKIKLHICDKEIDERFKTMLKNNLFELELEYNIDSGKFQTYARQL